ncbi:MAG: radical SAM protein [Holosporaceae bacterium]|jgi:DNA repair photolyase|nr:radical SAM protein [Holosporaceae bacterium]
MPVKEITCKTALHYHDREFASNWDLNIYRGCGHRCIYCFAQYSHKYLDTAEFFDDIFVKTNITEALHADFSKRSWNGDPVNICGVTDGYQPLEKEYVLMPRIIETFIHHKNPMIVTTKSTLLLRDIDLLDELNKIAGVSVQVSASVIDEVIREKIEPFASPTIERLEMIDKLSKCGISCGVLMMPIIPHLTDNIENLDAIFKIAIENGAKNIIPQVLHLRGNTKNVFFSYMRDLFPELESKIKLLYNGAYVNKNYLENFQEKIRNLRRKYNFYNNHRENCQNECKKQDTQLKLL